MSGLVFGRPGRRFLDPSYLMATSLRYHRRMVSGCHDAGDGPEAAATEDLASRRRWWSVRRSPSSTVR